MKNTENQKFLFWAVTAIIVIVLLVFVGTFIDVKPETMVSIFLVVAAALVGYALGYKGSTLPVQSIETIDKGGAIAQKQKQQGPARSVPGRKNPGDNYLRGILDELSLMQGSGDLLERYQCFIRVAENSLYHVLGPCSVSLWCPDHEHTNMIECVIKPSEKLDDSSGPGWANTHQMRQPCQVPLDSEVIRRAIKSGEPYIAFMDNTGDLMAGCATETSLPCDACVPLYRTYGQPLLIVAQRHRNVAVNFCPEDFDAAVKLINLFWKHLQTTNERQWIIEHDTSSGALRDEVFLRRAQSRAKQACRCDEPFTLVVITVRGFRSMFAGHAGQWRTLSGLVGRSLIKILSVKNEEFLFGKMADDVFALMLSRTDEFLARAMMDTLSGRLAQEIKNDPLIKGLDVGAIEVCWSLADHRRYDGAMEVLLDEIYRCLFRSEGDHKHSSIIELHEPALR